MVRDLYLRGLGLVAAVAVFSLWLQIHGLVGAHGILPVSEFLERVNGALGSEGYTRFPTLLWLSSSDLALHVLCAAGLALSLVLLAGRASSATLVALFAVYLSLTVGGQTFLSFQWDTLLLETILWSGFLLPLGFLPRPVRSLDHDPALGLLLLRLLLLKLMFLSGVVKPLSLDPTWLTLTALEVHYETQPLPNAVSWAAHWLPSWIQRASVAVVYVVEIVVPFLLFASRRWRLVAACVLIAFQGLIALTGNYGFFNLLTAVLCLAALDDRAVSSVGDLVSRSGSLGAWAGRLFARWRALSRQDAPPGRGDESRAASRSPAPRSRWHLLRIAAAAFLLFSSFAVTVRELARTLPMSERNPETRLAAALDLANDWTMRLAGPGLAVLSPCRCLNGYGLFRAMTTERPEIAIEWSPDGARWNEYHWRFKPDEPERRPRLAAPHMPRLDWQMWFAALAPNRADWLRPLAERLLEAEPDVLRLLRDPPAEAPRFVRFVLYDYRFASPGNPEGHWWQRERLGELSAGLSLEQLESSR